MMRLALASLSIVLIGAFSSGCGTTRVPASPDGPEPTEKVEATEPLGGADGSLPPESTLSYGGERVVGGLGTYCWSSASVGQCGDTVGIAVRDGALTVPAGSTLTFVYGGRGSTR